jgi:hypothetical protein
MPDENWNLEGFDSPLEGEQKEGPSTTMLFQDAHQDGLPVTHDVTPVGRTFDGLEPVPEPLINEEENL